MCTEHVAKWCSTSCVGGRGAGEGGGWREGELGGGEGGWQWAPDLSDRPLVLSMAGSNPPRGDTCPTTLAGNSDPQC